MQTNLFPQDYNNQVDANATQKINEAHNYSENQIGLIRRNLHYPAPSGEVHMWGIWVGLGGGFCACFGVCAEQMNIWAGVATYVAVFLISVLIGVLIDKSLKSAYKENELNIDRKIKAEEESLEQEIDDINVDAQREKDEYYTLFENNAQKMSVEFAESELAKEVIKWMTEGFCRTIDSADRRNHVEQVNVPFEFQVFNNKIIFNLGTFDFEIKRCRNLNSPLEQAALARAIVSAIQVNVIMKYPKDVTGTDVSIKISYSYTNQYAATTIRYVAPNGNFKTVRDW